MTAVQDTLNEDETVRVELDDGTALIERADGSGVVRFVIGEDHPDHDDPGVSNADDMEFDDYRDAALAFEIWRACGPFHSPESGQSMPVKVAKEGQEYVASYLLVGRGYKATRSAVASELGISERTVSNYASRVRSNLWDAVGSVSR